jgi:hypothetical protein
MRSLSENDGMTLTREDIERSTYMGRPLKELDRDGLLDVIVFLQHSLTRLQTQSGIRAFAIGQAEMMRRGIKYE